MKSNHVVKQSFTVAEAEAFLAAKQENALRRSLQAFDIVNKTDEDEDTLKHQAHALLEQINQLLAKQKLLNDEAFLFLKEQQIQLRRYLAEQEETIASNKKEWLRRLLGNLLNLLWPVPLLPKQWVKWLMMFPLLYKVYYHSDSLK